MEMTIDKFIKVLQSVAEEHRKLPLVITAPNGIQFEPRICMQFKDGIMLSEDSVIEKMIIDY